MNEPAPNPDEGCQQNTHDTPVEERIEHPPRLGGDEPYTALDSP
jgi:hypothetical protein